MASLTTAFSRVSTLLLLFDVFLIYVSGLSAKLIYGESLESLYHISRHTEIAVFALVMVYVFYLAELYDFHRWGGATRRIIYSYVFAVTPLLGISFFFPDHSFGRGTFLITYVGSGLLILAWRRASQPVLEKFRPVAEAVVIGTGSAAMDAADLLRKMGEQLYEIKGYLPIAGGLRLVPADKILPEDTDIVQYVSSNDVEKVIVALDDRRGSLPVTDLLKCKLAGVDVMDVPTLMEAFSNKISLNIHASSIIFASGFKRGRTARIVKSTLDRALAVIVFILALPFLLLVPLLVKATSRGPVLFRQTRVGENEKEFEILKFRTMRVDAEKDGPVWAREKDDRITPVGKFLRKTRLDELPQLFNVLQGEMSFVGPRPERPVFVDKLKDTIPYYSQRHAVKPGITGWAQVRYKYGSTVQDAAEKLQYDLYYIKHFSIFLDVYIIFETIRSVIIGKGAQ